MSDHPELICAYRLDGNGKGVALDWQGVVDWAPGQETIWIHLDCTHEKTESWLREQSGLDAFVIDGLLASETRPRCEDFEDGVLVVLRGVNHNPGSDPEDMVSIRIWIDEHRVISTRIRQLMAVGDIAKQLITGKGPVSPGHLVARLAAQLTARMGPAIEQLREQMADLEERLIGAENISQADLKDSRYQLSDLRRKAISLRRYASPQREALNNISNVNEAWLDTRIQGRLRETVDRVTRIVEELDEIRDRSAVLQDELVSRISQRMERTMFVLTIVATVILPLSFLTGLLGINVGGIPGAEVKWAFWAVCGVLGIVVVIEIWLFKWLKWF